MAKRRVFFDTNPAYNCTRIEIPIEGGEYAALPATATSVREVDESDIPSDRTFRSAWNADLTVDMVKARDIHRGRLDKESRLTPEKEAAIASARTPEELKAVKVTDADIENEKK